LAHTGGYAILEALVYAFAGAVLVGVALAALYYCVGSSLAFRRNVDDISQTLLAGERWRSEVRTAGGRIKFAQEGDDQLFILTKPEQQVTYRFATNAVWRRLDAGNWVCALTNVKSSLMAAELRSGVNAWRWELELMPRAKRPGKVRPLFTFLAAGEGGATR
jgi:hypothetical protein